jgi:cob(I)alamin adenosyltransferase
VNPNKRVAKDDIQIEVYGTIDELNSSIGLLLANKDIPVKLSKILHRIQQELIDLTKELYNPAQTLINKQHIDQIEHDIDKLNANLPELTAFILPGGNLSAATCHLVRCICRRAERRLVTLISKTTAINPQILQYLNRLSDLLFVIARHL